MVVLQPGRQQEVWLTGPQNLRADLVLWFSSLHKGIVNRKDAVKEAWKRKSLKCAEPAADAQQCSWEAEVCPVEVGYRGFMGKTTTRLFGDFGV